MAQLSEDSFAVGASMMSIEAVVRIITETVKPVADTETVSVAAADGRVLAADVTAPLPLPPYTNSAVDGYAVRADDLPEGTEANFAMAGRVPAGSSAAAPIPAAHAIRIFTGAPMPDGADTVFMQEDVRVADDGRVVLPVGLKPGANVRPAGEDIALGEVALVAGQRLLPQHVAVAAALGLTTLTVRRRIRVAVFSTGDELAAPGTKRAPAQLYDSNRVMLTAMLTRLGCEVSDLGIFRDQRAPLAAALREAAGRHDLLLTSGGVSTGEEDHVKAAVESVGSLVMWRMAIKPGRPLAMGIIAGTPFIGLPGNPVASFVTAAHVVRPTVLALAGARPQPLLPMPLRAAFTHAKKAGRREYVPVSLRRAADGTLEVIKFPRQGAGLLSSLIGTDGFVELGEAVTSIAPGQVVSFLSYAELI